MAVAPVELPRFAHLSWPKALRTADGIIVLGYLAGSEHTLGNCPVVSVSTDDGRTFSPPHVLREFGPGHEYTNSGNMALGLAHDGAVILLAHGHRGNEANHIFDWRSADSGRTWRPVDTTALGPNKTGSATGTIVQLPGRRLMVTGHYRGGSSPYTTGIWQSVSEDDGQTWGEPAMVNNLNAGELVAITSERPLPGSIQLWRGNAKTLAFRHNRTLVELPKVEGDPNTDYGYAWLVPLVDRRALVFYYHGQGRGENSIWVLETTL